MFDCVTTAAWFTDLPHKVEPVTSGTRVVLQFDVAYAGLHEDRVEELLFDHNNEDELAKRAQPTVRADSSLLDAFVKEVRGFWTDKVVVETTTDDDDDNNSTTTSSSSLKKKKAKKTTKTTKKSQIALLLHHRYVRDSLDVAHLKAVDRSLYDAFASLKDDAFTVRLETRDVDDRIVFRVSTWRTGRGSTADR